MMTMSHSHNQRKREIAAPQDHQAVNVWYTLALPEKSTNRFINPLKMNNSLRRL